ncbi:hypothetical protein DYI95_010525 [Thermaerobacter sp. PB12/4term]|uniref:hypothetical protein n=1 Tax=Thermaerobacter sp. PB12/4term TaxID=2293838 RepID=UPI000E32A11A|nr:hypothetical protein [Thermaerobacter sp. PB12/4term]QIA27887.1 hypothetical protein DYI95_010525 [Thermaerobacter sp. PB12/4term]
MTASLLPLEHLTDADFGFLAAAVSPRPDARDRIARLLRDGGEAIERALEDGRTHQALEEGDAARKISPYLLFSLLLHQCRIQERARAGDPAPSGDEPVLKEPPAGAGSGAGDDLVLLDGPGGAPATSGPCAEPGRSRPVLALLESPWTVHYLAELLASFAYTPPGMAAFTLGSRQYRLPLAEVDLAALNKVALLAAEPDRLSIYRRLGDLTLFLSSVALPAGEGGTAQPQSATPTPPRPAGLAAGDPTPARDGDRPGDGRDRDRATEGCTGRTGTGRETPDAVPVLPYSEGELEREGRRFYEYAAQHRGAGTTYLGRTLAVLASRYGTARTLLRRIVQQELPRVYPGGLHEMASRWGHAPQPGAVALSAPEGPAE